MKVKTEKIPGMVDNLLKPFDGLVLELVEQTAKAMFYRDALDGDVDFQRINDPLGDIEPENRFEWAYRYNYLLKAIEYLEEEGLIESRFIEEFVLGDRVQITILYHNKSIKIRGKISGIYDGGVYEITSDYGDQRFECLKDKLKPEGIR